MTTLIAFPAPVPHRRSAITLDTIASAEMMLGMVRENAKAGDHDRAIDYLERARDVLDQELALVKGGRR